MTSRHNAAPITGARRASTSRSAVSGRSRPRPAPPRRTPLERSLPLAVVGAGSMAEALIHGLLRTGLTRAGDIRVNNRSDRARLERLAGSLGVAACLSKEEVLAGAGLVVLAVKPADVEEALTQCRRALETLAAAGAAASRPSLPLFISVAAGVETGFIEEHLPPDTPVIRAMPNTSCGVGEAATALSTGRSAGTEHLAVAEQLFGAVGYVTRVDEELMDAVTALSGSGPAYLYLFLEALTEAGAGLGLEPELSYQLALQTVKGAALTAQSTGRPPEELRRKVSSPGGTTVAGLAALERHGFREGVVEAVRRAALRAADLSSAGCQGPVRQESTRQGGKG